MTTIILTMSVTILLLFFACVALVLCLTSLDAKKAVLFKRAEDLENRIEAMQQLVWKKFNYHLFPTSQRLEIELMKVQEEKDAQRPKHP